MRPLPITENPQVIRVDFSNDSAWEAICVAIAQPQGPEEFLAYVYFLNDKNYLGISKDQLMNFVPRNYGHSFLMVVDGATILHPENPLVIVDLWDEPGREFRAIPSQIQSIENNLSLGNMGFAEFADVVDCDSIFRGFPIH